MGFDSYSGLYCINLDDKTTNMLSKPPVNCDMAREALLLQNYYDDFIVVAALKDGLWYLYSSKSDRWAFLANWKHRKGVYNQNYLVYSLRNQSFFFHVHQTDRWEMVKILKPEGSQDPFFCQMPYERNRQKRLIPPIIQQTKNTERDKLQSIGLTTSSTSDVFTCHNDASCGGAIYDNTRNAIVSVSYGAYNCCNIYITSLDTGTTTVKSNIIPYNVLNHAPVYDGKQYVYFMEYMPNNKVNKRFGRIDLETFEFEELQSIPDKNFAALFSGCFHNGNIYAINGKSELYCYTVLERKWNRCGIRIPSAGDASGTRLLNDPRNESRHIYMMRCGNQDGLYCIDLDEKTVYLLSKPPVAFDQLREALFIHTAYDEFVLVIALKKR